MSLSVTDWRRLEDKAAQLRATTLQTVIWAGSGHIGGALSAIDALTVLYYDIMNFDGNALDDPDRDRFVLSKGHIGVGYAPLLADLGCFDPQWLTEYNHTGSPLGMHLDSKKVPGVEVSTGSLGHGLPIALGLALGARLRREPWRVFCMLGDGECNEGSIWEAAMAASHFKAGNLVALIDRNGAMIDGPTEDVMALEPLAEKWQAFGWHTQRIDGHDIPAIHDALTAAVAVEDAPSVVILDTVKGEGIDWIEGDYTWHYGAFDEVKAAEAKAALGRHHEVRVTAVKGH